MSDKKESEPETSSSAAQPSLQTLSENEALTQILRPEFTDSQFTSLPSHLQKLLFEKLRGEIDRLRAKEKKWIEVVQRCAPADLELYTRVNRNPYKDNVILVKPGDDNKEKNESQPEVEPEPKLKGYALRKYFIRRWNYLTEQEEGEVRQSFRDMVEENNDNDDKAGDDEDKDREASTEKRPVRTIWSSWDLYRDDDSGVKLNDHRRLLFAAWSNGIAYEISSQLLFYRLTATFGMPPVRMTDEYKMCWDISLHFPADNSLIMFSDHKGSSSVAFIGGEEGSKEGLKLVNYLVGKECLHTYDGILAGTIA